MQQLNENMHRIPKFKAHNDLDSLFEARNDSNFHLFNSIPFHWK